MEYIVHYENGPTYADCRSTRIEANSEDEAEYLFRLSLNEWDRGRTTLSSIELVKN